MKQAMAANYLLILEKCLKQHGVNNFLKQIDIDEALAHDPSAYLSQDEFTHILDKAYEYSRLPYLGLLLGDQLSIANHGLLGYAAMASPTLGAAIQTLLDYLETRTSLISGSLNRSQHFHANVELKLLTEDAISIRFLTEMAFAHLLKLRNFLTNITSDYLKIEIAYPEPTYASFYTKFLPGTICFNAEKTRIIFPATDLDTPISFADDVSYQQATMQLQTISEQLHAEDNLASYIEKILYEKELHRVTMKEIADQLCLSIRTLRRHLRQNNTNFRQIVERVRQEKAKHLLTHTALSITEISFLLGFRDHSNFTKAFKRWLTMTPSAYRIINKSK